MSRVLTCLGCGMTEPPPEETCTAGRRMMDHRVGKDAGCPWCGRLVEACRRRPCTRRRDTWRSRLRMTVRARIARRASGRRDAHAPVGVGGGAVRDPDFARWTAADLRDLRRDLAMSLGLSPPASPMGLAIRTQIAAIDTELARRPGTGPPQAGDAGP